MKYFLSLLALVITSCGTKENNSELYQTDPKTVHGMLLFEEKETILN